MILTLLNGDKRLVNLFGGLQGLKIKFVKFDVFEMACIGKMSLLQKNSLKCRIGFAMSKHTPSKRVHIGGSDFAWENVR